MFNKKIRERSKTRRIVDALYDDKVRHISLVALNRVRGLRHVGFRRLMRIQRQLTRRIAGL